MILQFLPQAKLAAQLVSGLGVSKILGDIIKNNVTVLTPTQSITVKVGTFVLGSMLVEQSSNHIEAQVTNVLDVLQKRNEDSTDTQ